ncbi:hypothetical protein BKA62DRAFT_774416 [Auriculariales sp. MPI-PUGE-AT-0066]|nr:hypothetical protein BKA62DRAFT_774416 [Auriculariales sp. MPI-PUGE-AT-0066]
MRTHSARGSFIRDTTVNTLLRGRSEDEISTYELLNLDESHSALWVDIGGSAALLANRLMVELAIVSHDSLAGLLAPDDNLMELVDALAGGYRGIQLALADTKYFLTTASHGRVISSHWWDDMKAQLLNLTEERWSTRKYKYHDTPQALVDEIETVGPCEECVATITEARQILDGLAAIYSTSAVQHKGVAESRRSHELEGNEGIPGAALLDATATVSHSGWRRVMERLCEIMGIQVHHLPGDTELQPVGRIERVEV